jgi:LysR family glycine cleavage system transcriptional activator
MSSHWKTLPSLTSLRAFEATGGHGGFAGAARALNVTHAAVAQQVRALEAELGVSLAVRTGRTVSLTDAGARLAAALAEGFGAIAAAVDDIRVQSASRPLRIVARPFLVDRLIMPNLARFWQMHPGVEISILPRRDFTGLTAASFDLAIPSLRDGCTPDIPGTDSHLIARVPIVAIAAPSLVAERGRDPVNLPWLWHEEDMDLKLSVMAESGLPVDRLRQVRIGSPNLQAEAVRQGLGAALFNASIARSDILSGDVVEVPLPRKAYVTYFAVYPKGPRHALIDPFVNWLESLI